MKKMRLVTVLLLAMPLAALGAHLEPVAVSQDRPVVEDANDQYQCCWIIYLGQLLCVPC